LVFALPEEVYAANKEKAVLRHVPKDLAELTIDGYQAIRLGPEDTSQATIYIAKDNYVYELHAHDFTNVFGKMIKLLNSTNGNCSRMSRIR